jgi:hypothetical protein
MGRSSNPFGLETRLFGGNGNKLASTTAALNSATELGYNQAVVDIALASLQMEENMAMVFSAEGSSFVVGEESVLAVSTVTSEISKKPFSDKL